MDSPDSSQPLRLQRTDSFIPDDGIDEFFVSDGTSKASSYVGTALFALILCAILSLI